MEARKYEEAEGLEEEVLGIAKQYNRRSKMTTKAKKPIVKDPNKVPSSKVNKQQMVDAIVGLERQMHIVTSQLDLLNDAFRQYIAFQNHVDTFQEYLNNTTKEREAAAKKLADESNTKSK